ncbi:MAG: ATP-binding protein, partial [Syntrophales bacterium]|nr:ATP-binding protein [Syntrophales bacterium]
SLGEEDIRTVDVTISPVNGLPRGDEKTMLVFHDVTRLKKLEKMRVDFVANATHEIKTPLTAILGFIETLKEGAIDDRKIALQFLQTIHNHAQRLNRLVDDLLTISDIELGETKISFEDISFVPVIEGILPIIELQASKKDITVKTELPEELPLVKADRDKVIQIFLNVLDNAVKFTDEGGTVSISAQDNGDGKVAVRISDTGIGIPKAEIPRLGERFYRVDKTRSREMGGTGLGLSIVKHLLMAHRGSMSIDSRPGRGTTISLFFPIAKSDYTFID